MNGDSDPWWEPIREFFLHIVVGLAIFLLIAAAAVVLDLLVGVLEGLGVDDMVIAGLKLAEYSLFGIDLTLLVVYVARLAFRTVRKLW